MSDEDEAQEWEALWSRWQKANSSEKADLLADAVLIAANQVNRRGHNSKPLMALYVQLQDKKYGSKSTLLDIPTEQPANRPAKISLMIKQANAAAAVDAYMKIGLKEYEAAEKVAEALGQTSDEVIRFRRSLREDNRRFGSDEYAAKVAGLKGLPKEDLEKLASLFCDTASSF